MKPRILTDAEVAAMRTEWWTRPTRKSLAEKYGVSEETVKKVLNDRMYRWQWAREDDWPQECST